MITKQQIKELNAIISYLNQTESLCDEDLADKVEDIKFLVKVLTTVKISKIKKLINNRYAEVKSQKVLHIQRTLLFSFCKFRI